MTRIGCWVFSTATGRAWLLSHAGLGVCSDVSASLSEGVGVAKSGVTVTHDVVRLQLASVGCGSIRWASDRIGSINNGI